MTCFFVGGIFIKYFIKEKFMFFSIFCQIKSQSSELIRDDVISIKRLLCLRLPSYLGSQMDIFLPEDSCTTSCSFLACSFMDRGLFRTHTRIRSPESGTLLAELDLAVDAVLGLA